MNNDNKADEDSSFKSLSEIMDEFTAEFDEWLKTRKKGCAEYLPEDELIVIRSGRIGQEYFIPLNQLQTAIQFTDWIWQLNDKTWCSGEVLKDFLSCLQMVTLERTGKTPQAFFVWS